MVNSVQGLSSACFDIQNQTSSLWCAAPTILSASYDALKSNCSAALTSGCDNRVFSKVMEYGNGACKLSYDIFNKCVNETLTSAVSPYAFTTTSYTPVIVGSIFFLAGLAGIGICIAKRSDIDWYFRNRLKYQNV